MKNDLSESFGQNPILRPQDLRPTVEGMEVTCLLNPGVFRYNNKTWLLVRVAERPIQQPGRISFPGLKPDGRIEVLAFRADDPRLELTDPRVISFDGQDFLTTLSHLRLLSSDDGDRFTEPAGSQPLMGTGELETYGIEDCRVVNHEFGLFLGRGLGCCLFLGIAYWGSGVAALKYALPVIALLQLFSIGVAGQISRGLTAAGIDTSPVASQTATIMEA